MLLYLLLGLLALLVLPPLLQRLAASARAPANRQRLNRLLLWLVVGLIVFLAATGRLNWLFAAVAVAVPAVLRLLHVLQYLPALRRLVGVLGGGTGAAPRDSSIATRSLRVALDHGTGAMQGEVLAGRFAGRSLASLSLAELEALLEELSRLDPESRPLLEAYLERMHGEAWRGRQSAGPAAPPPPAGGPMSREEAYAVLGLEPGAEREAILAAHRRLMQKLHPDRGGSTYLAAKLNQAKDCLLGA